MVADGSSTRLRHPKRRRTLPLFPYTPLFRSRPAAPCAATSRTWRGCAGSRGGRACPTTCASASRPLSGSPPRDRKSTRLNSSHSQISYAVFRLKKKTTRKNCSRDGCGRFFHAPSPSQAPTDASPLSLHAALPISPCGALRRDLEGLARLCRESRRPRLPDDVRLRIQAALRVPAERSEEHTSELQSQSNLVCRLPLEKKNNAQELLARWLRTVLPRAFAIPSADGRFPSFPTRRSSDLALRRPAPRPRGPGAAVPGVAAAAPARRRAPPHPGRSPGPRREIGRAHV